VNSITEFEREFTCIMRGYSPREVDEAIDMLISYGAELESANAEFAEVNDALMQQNDAAAAELDRLRSENAALREETRGLQEELEAGRAAYAEMKQRLAEANARADGLRSDSESVLGQIAARCDAEEKRYSALTRRTAALTEAVRALYAEHMQAIDALTEVSTASAAESSVPARPVIRRAAMAAAAVVPEPEELEVQPPRAIPRVPRRQAAPAVQATPAAEAESAESVPPEGSVNKSEEALTHQLSVPTETVTMELESAQVDTVYRPAKPSAIKVIRDTDTEKTPTHSFAAVRRTLDEIGSKLK
jgi:DivIVA domain-containing protein